MSNTTTTTVDYTTTDPATIGTTYGAASVAEKSNMRSAVVAAMSAAIMAGDMAGATNAAACQNAMVAARPASAPTDYRPAIANRRASLVAAIAAIDAGDYVMPSGAVAPNVSDIDFSAGVADDGDVARYVTVSGRKTGRGNVADYVSAIMADASGPMKVSAIRDAWTPDTFGDYPVAAPSAGAIGAMFDRVIAGTCDVDWDIVDVNGSRGAAPRV